MAPPRVLACAPSDATAEEIEALRDALRRAGASIVTVVPEPLAAATGLGLDPTSPHAQLLVNVGEGVTDVAFIRRGQIESARAPRVGCFDIRQAVANLLASSHGLLPPTEATEDLIRRADASDPDVETLFLEIRDASSRDLERTIAADRAALFGAMESPLDRIAGLLRVAWDAQPSESREEVKAHGL